MNYVAIQGENLQKKVLDIVVKEYRSETEEQEDDEDDGYSYEEPKESSDFESMDSIKEEQEVPEVD